MTRYETVLTEARAALNALVSARPVRHDGGYPESLRCRVDDTFRVVAVPLDLEARVRRALLGGR